MWAGSLLLIFFLYVSSKWGVTSHPFHPPWIRPWETKSRWLSRYSQSLRWLIVLVKLHWWLFEKIKQKQKFATPKHQQIWPPFWKLTAVIAIITKRFDQSARANNINTDTKYNINTNINTYTKSSLILTLLLTSTLTVIKTKILIIILIHAFFYKNNFIRTTRLKVTQKLRTN